MLKLICEVGRCVEVELEKFADTGEEFELKQLYGKFTMDSLASAVFGVNTESFTQTNSRFIESASRIFRNTPSDMALFMLSLIPGMSYIMRKLDISVMKPKATKFLMDVIKKTIKQRQESNIRRNDIIDLMLDIMKGKGVDNEEDAHKDEQFEQDSKLAHSQTSKVPFILIVFNCKVCYNVFLK